jgi:hypothetical protein
MLYSRLLRALSAAATVPLLDLRVRRGAGHYRRRRARGNNLKNPTLNPGFVSILCL